MGAIQDFRDRYSGRDAKAEDLEHRATKATVQTMENALLRITSAIARARADVSYGERRKQAALLKEIGQELARLKAELGEEMTEGMKAMADYAAECAQEDMRRLGMTMPADDGFFDGINTSYIKAAHADAFEHVAALTDNISRSTKRLLQQEAAQISRRAAVEGVSRRRAYRMLRDTLEVKLPDFAFVDRRGRKWATKDYLEMLTRTTMADTLREGYANTLAAAGHDLVIVSSHGARDACRNWEGKVLSLTGATEGYPTVAEAKDSGEVLHPRCRHRLLAYHQG